MNLIVNNLGIIVAAVDYAVDEDELSKRGDKVAYVDNSVYTVKMIGSIFTSDSPFYIPAPTPYHSVQNGEWVITDSGKNEAQKKATLVRNTLLQQTDWTQLPDVVLTKEQSKIFKKYRQELRDLPSVTDDPLELLELLKEYKLPKLNANLDV